MVDAAAAEAAATRAQHDSCLVLRDVTIAYGRRVVLAHVDADIPRGELVSIVGPNGAGKSTLLKAIAGLIPLAGGEITLFGEPITRMRKRVAYVPQREDVEWSFPVSVRDVVLMGRYPQRGWLRPSTAEDRAAVAAALEQLGITDLAARQVAELSGGQQRRAFIARALAQESDVILLDEPMAGIDAETHDRILDLFEEWRAQRRVVLQATHTHMHGGSMIVLHRRAEPIPAHQFAHHAEEGGEHHEHAH
ncbi:MAG TPA: ABC transporter ATP-binding protein [Dehalococcoidia bacterium]|nr:ABC transporter ATP-binding protein [Dehalococcoidia bacterium]